MNKFNTSDAMKKSLERYKLLNLYKKKKKFLDSSIPMKAIEFATQNIPQWKLRIQMASCWRLTPPGLHNRFHETEDECFPAHLRVDSQTKTSEQWQKTPQTSILYHVDEKLLSTILPDHIRVFIKKGNADRRLFQECKVVYYSKSQWYWQGQGDNMFTSTDEEKAPDKILRL